MNHDSPPVSPLDRLATAAALAVLNHLLAREPWAREKLAPFAGRSARIGAGPFAVALAVADGGMLTVAQGVPAVSVAVAMDSLPAMLLDPGAAMRKVRLAGDAEFAQALAFVLTNLKPDAEEELSRFVGDAAAVRIVDTVRATLAQVRVGGERLARTTADYFVAENPLLVARTEVDAFGRAVTALRDGVARLEKRIERIERAERQ